MGRLYHFLYSVVVAELYQAMPEACCNSTSYAVIILSREFMHHISTIIQQPKARRHRSDLSQMLTLVVVIGLVSLVIASLAFSAAVRVGIAPAFDQQIVLDRQHRLVIHYGSPPTCAFILNPPQHDCFKPGLEHREFAVDYLTPNGVRPLLWLQLPVP